MAPETRRLNSLLILSSLRDVRYVTHKIVMRYEIFTKGSSAGDSLKYCIGVILFLLAFGHQ